MNALETIKLAITSLFNNKLRSFLTMLGIIIGISAVITITTIGSTIKTTLEKEFNSLGINMVGFDQFYVDDEGNYAWDEDVELFSFTSEMIEEFEKENPGFHYVVGHYASATIKNEDDKEFDMSANFVNYGLYQSSKLKILDGRGLTQKDIENGKHVALVNKDFALKYYGGVDKAVGNVLEFNVNETMTVELMVVGVYEKEGMINSAVGTMYGGSYELYSAYDIIEKKAMEIFSYERQNYYLEFYYDETVDASLTSSIVDDYFSNLVNDPHIVTEVYNLNDEINEFMGILTIVTVAISVIAGIALIVGGVGVMNIMLVSVVERTKEIGIEKALGARNNDIRFQFLLEAVVICLVGCIIGILIGLLNGFLITAIAGPVISNIAEIKIRLSFEPPWNAIIFGCVFSSLIGIFFGLYPANKAAKLNPIDALRYE